MRVVRHHPKRGHNHPPPDGASVRTRWAKALFANPDTPTYVMAMAWVIHWYSDKDGCGAAVSNEQFEAICGVSTATATRGKRWLRDKGYVKIKVGDGRGLKSSFRMTLPQAAKGDLRDDLSLAKGHQKEGVLTEHLSKGHQTDPKGHQCDRKGHQGDRPILDNSGGIQEKGVRASATPAPTRNEIDELHRLAFEAGQRIKGGATAKSTRATRKTKGELDGSGGVLFENGKLTVFNGVRAALTLDYPGIDLQAVCDRAGPEITKLNYPTTSDAVACIRKWASYAAEHASKLRTPAGQTPGKPTVAEILSRTRDQ